MRSKVIFCVLILCFKFVALIPLSEEPIQQAASKQNNWQNNQDSREQSWNYDTGFSRTQNVNAAANSPQQYENGQDYNTHHRIQRENNGYKNQHLPFKPLPQKEGQSSQLRSGDSHINPGEFNSMKKDNRHVSVENQQNRQQNLQKQNQFYAASSASTSDVIRHERPNEQNRWMGNGPRTNFRNLQNGASYPTARNKNYNSESNYRSRPESASYETYDEVPFTAPNTKAEKSKGNRYVENSASYFGDANLPILPIYHGPPIKSDNFKKMGNYNINDKNKQADNFQNPPTYNMPKFNNFPIASNPILSNSDNVKYVQNSGINSGLNRNVPNTYRYGTNPGIASGIGGNQDKSAPDRPLSKIPNYTYNDNNPALLEAIAENKENQAINSEADSKTLRNMQQEIPTVIDQDKLKSFFENTNLKDHGHRFMIIHKNDTVEFIDDIGSILDLNFDSATMDKEDTPTNDNNKPPFYNTPQNQQVPYTDNYYQPPNVQSPTSSDYNPVENNRPPNERNRYPPSMSSRDTEWIDGYVPSVSDFFKPSQERSFSNTGTSDEMIQKKTDSYSDKSDDNIAVGITGTGPLQPSDSDDNPLPEFYKSSENNNYYKSKPIWENPSTTPPSNIPDPDEKKIQQFLDSLPDNDRKSTPLNSNNKNAQSRPMDDNHYWRKPIQKSNSGQRSATNNPEDESVQEFLDSLNKTASSTPSSVPSSDDVDTTTQAVYTFQPTGSSSILITTSTASTMDEITTISPVETSTDRVQKQDSQQIYNGPNTFSDDKDDKNIGSQKNSDDSVATNSTKQSDANSNDNSTDTNELKLILNIPNDSAGTLKVAVNGPDSTGNDDGSNDETLKIQVDTKEYSDSNSPASKFNTKSSNNSAHKSAYDGADKNDNIFIDILNSGMMFSKMSDKSTKNPPADNSVVNMWYLIPMQPQCQAMVEKSKVTTIYPNGTVVEEITKTTWKSKDDSAPTMEKTTKIFHNDPEHEQ